MNTLFNKVFGGCNMELYINNPEYVKRLMAMGKVSDTMRGIPPITLEQFKKFADDNDILWYYNKPRWRGVRYSHLIVDEFRKSQSELLGCKDLIIEHCVEPMSFCDRMVKMQRHVNLHNKKKREKMKINLEIAKICHATNQAYCEKSKLEGAPVWDELPLDVQESIVAGVAEVIADPKVTPTQIHQMWCNYKEKEGWKYALNKDLKLKTHPNLVPFKDLPDLEKRKDVLFIRTVRREMKK